MLNRRRITLSALRFTLGDLPTTPAARRDWLTSVVTVAAYRDRYGITSDLPLGPGARTEAEQADRRQVLAAQRRATAIARSLGTTHQPAPISSSPIVR